MQKKGPAEKKIGTPTVACCREEKKNKIRKQLKKKVLT